MLARRTGIVGLSAFVAAGTFARTSQAAPGVWNKNGIALAGYDSTAYWTAKKSAVGQAGFEFEWKGVKWRFASQASRDAFAAQPDKYAPQFNGYCPFCLAGGKLVAGLVDYWDIYRDKLYLLLSHRVHDDFVMKRDYYIERATTYWAKLS
jgi:YHS domain-containing protein